MVSKVVESGLARCPRCVSVADYVFLETRSGRESSNGQWSPGECWGLRYEVRCRKCGECYGEDSRPVARDSVAVAVAAPPIVWPPDREPVEARDWRNELRGRLSTAGDQLSTAGGALSVAAQRGKSEVDVWVRRTRGWVLDRRLRQREGHTGG